jgi:hypothetical protein
MKEGIWKLLLKWPFGDLKTRSDQALTTEMDKAVDRVYREAVDWMDCYRNEPTFVYASFSFVSLVILFPDEEKELLERCFERLMENKEILQGHGEYYFQR